MQDDHIVQCNCLECITPIVGNHLDVASYLNTFLRSKHYIAIYSRPGGKPIRTAKPNTYIGRIVAFNEKKNWAKLSDNTYVVFQPDLFTFKDAGQTPPLTFDQKMDVALSVAKNIPGAQTGADAAILTKEGGEKVIALIPNFKVILIIVVVVILGALFLRLKG